MELPAIAVQTKVHARAVGAALQPPTVRRLEAGTDVLALFDLEGTLMPGSLVTQYLSVMGRLHPAMQLPGELADLVGKTNVYLQAERRDRGEFVRAFSRRYEGTRVADIERLVGGAWGQSLLRRIRPGALTRIEEHEPPGTARAGHRVP